jgi:dipeptidyl aminopeptidase/acylaminoacyl peptidase
MSILNGRAFVSAPYPSARSFAAAPWSVLMLMSLGCAVGATAAPPPELASAREAALEAALEAAGPTVQQVIEFTRIIQPRNQNHDELQRQVSPDGRRAFIVTRRAELHSDSNVFELLLFDLAGVDFAVGTAAPPRRLLSVVSRKDENQADPTLQDVRWAGDGTLVYRARLDDGLFQVYRLDLASGRVQALTRETRRIVAYAVSDDLRRVVYTVQTSSAAWLPGERSVVVGNQSFWSIKHGAQDWRVLRQHYQFVGVDVGQPGATRALGQPFEGNLRAGGDPSLSPDGRWVLLPQRREARQREWAARYPRVGELSTQGGPSVLVDPLGYFSRPQHYVPRSWQLYRWADGSTRAVLDAPDDTAPGHAARPDRLWFGGGRSVVLAGTFLPPAADGRADPRSHIVEYWPAEDRWAVIAPLAGWLQSARRVQAGADAFELLDGAQRRRFERQAGGGWAEVPPGGPAPAEGRARWHIEQGLNRPPDLVVSDAAGRQVRLTQLNPGVTAAWGSMRPYAWSDAAGRRWEGGLMVPAGFDPARRHPLVIQAYGFVADRFYLDGANGADGFTSGFAGRAFLREGLLVLALPVRPAAPGARAHDPAAFNDAVRGAVGALVREGLVDRDRVGILGFSATGEQVLNLVTFTDVPIRAATLIDGDANTLFSLAVTYAGSDNFTAKKEARNGGLPLGDTRANWMRSDPSLHTDCIRAALRIESYGPWVLNNWDIYALLRRQYKPVEMLVIPEGTHLLSRPSERMISLQGNVDWYRFWLKGEERGERLAHETEESLAAQYTRWRQMAALKQADDARPPCVAPVPGGGP